MKKVFLALAIVVLFSSIGFAADPKPIISDEKPAPPAKSAAPAKKQKPVPFNGPVVAVDKTAKTVTVGKNKLRVFQITGDTRINKDKKPATLDQIVVGEQIGGAYRESAEGKLEVVTLNAGERGNGKAAEETKEKKKKS